MTYKPQPIRKPRPQYRTGPQALPHPSWRHAVAGQPADDGRKLESARQFWAMLGI